MKKALPNAYTVYLEPAESPELIRQRIIRRGDMSPQQARGRASKIPSHIRSSKMMNFNKRIITRQGQFDSIALEIMNDIPKSNPGLPFRVPESARPEMERRLTEMMMQPGYKPLTIKEAINEGIYDDQPSDFSYAQGEYEEFLEEIEKGDMDEAFAEYSDVEGHVAYWLYTNHGIEVPMYNTIHVEKTRKRVEVFADIFAQFGLKMDSKYLKGGSNFQKTTKVRLALETAAKDQGKSFNATDEEIRDAIDKAVPDVVMENPFGRFRKMVKKPRTPIFSSSPEKMEQYREDLRTYNQYRDKINQMEEADRILKEDPTALDPINVETLRIGGVTIPISGDIDKLTDYEKQQLGYQARMEGYTAGDGGSYRRPQDVFVDRGGSAYLDRVTKRSILAPLGKEVNVSKVTRPLMLEATRVTRAEETGSSATQGKYIELVLRRNFAKIKDKIDNARAVIVPRNQIGNINLDAVDVAQARINDMIANFDKLEEEDRVTSGRYKPKGGSGAVQSLRVRLEKQQQRTGEAYDQVSLNLKPGEQMLLDLYDSISMVSMTTTLDHEFTHRADQQSYLQDVDFSRYEYDKDGKPKIIPGSFLGEAYVGSSTLDVEGSNWKKRDPTEVEMHSTKMMEGSAQQIEQVHEYAGLDTYYITDNNYLGVLFYKSVMSKDEFSRFYRIPRFDEDGLETVEFQEAYALESIGDINQYLPDKEVLEFYVVEARDNQQAKVRIKEHLGLISKEKDLKPIIFVNPRNNPAFPSKYYNAHLYASGSRDPFFPGDVPVAPPDLLRGNPSKKPVSVRIEESPNKEKKMVAYFYDKDGKKVKTTHFGARGMSDYTQHKDPKRMKRYLARHGKMGEDWKDPTTAGALSRWILWGKPSLRESFNDYKKKFRLEGVMTVTNTRMNPNRIPKKYEGQDPSEHSDLFTDEDPKGTIQGLGFKDKETAERSINIIKRSGKTHAHKIQAAMAMEQRARFHAHQTPGIRAGQKVYAKFIEEMKKKTKEMRKNPPKISHYPDPDPESPKDMQRIDLHEEGKNIGFLLWYRKDDKTWIHYVNVRKAHRGKNLGRLLINELLSKTKGEKIHLHAPIGTPREHLVQWYESMGFKLLEGDTNEMVLQNPSRTPEGRKIPKKYLKGLNSEEMAIAAREIDKGYKYDLDDPKAYEEWKSDIKAKARGYKTVPSKYKKKFIKMYGPLPEKGEFLDKMAKATGIKKSILKKVYDKGLAAWATGHRVGVAPHQWATGRVYSFVTLGNTVKKGNKKMPDYSLAVEAGLVKKNPNEAPGNRIFNEPLLEALEVAEGYMRSMGKTYKTTVPIMRLNEPLLRRMAKAYNETPNGYDDPKTIKSYEAFIKETNAQFLAIRKAGYDVELDDDDPYRSSQHMIDDLRDNKRLKIFSAEAGFGSKPITDEQRKKNVLLRRTKHKDINGKTLLVEEMFRFTHDFFGHALKGNGFGPIGEENAWSSHSMMYSPLARPAMTTETRAQFAWTFYSGANDGVVKARRLANKLRREGKLDEAEKLRKEIQGKFLYPDQKMILLPKEFTENTYPLDNPGEWRHGKMMDEDKDPFSSMFA